MSIPVKAGIGILTAGSIAGVSYAGVSYFGKENIQEVNNTQQRTAISELIKQEYKFVLLDVSEESNNKDESYWTENWRAYKADNTDRENDILGLAGWSRTDARESTVTLKRKCKELATEKVLNRTEDLYQNVTKYCCRGVTVEEDAKTKGLTILKTDTTNDDSKIWTARESSVTDLRSSLNLLGITGDSLTAENIKSGCNTAKAKNKKLDNYDAIYEAYTKVCTKQPEDTQS